MTVTGKFRLPIGRLSQSTNRRSEFFIILFPTKINSSPGCASYLHEIFPPIRAEKSFSESFLFNYLLACIIVSKNFFFQIDFQINLKSLVQIIFRFIWNQTEFHLNQIYRKMANTIWFGLIRIRSRFVVVVVDRWQQDRNGKEAREEIEPNSNKVQRGRYKMKRKYNRRGKIR